MDWSLFIGILGIAATIAVGVGTFRITESRSRRNRYLKAKEVIVRRVSEMLKDDTVPDVEIIKAIIRSIEGDQGFARNEAVTIQEVVDDLICYVSTAPGFDTGRRQELLRKLIETAHAETVLLQAKTTALPSPIACASETEQKRQSLDQNQKQKAARTIKLKLFAKRWSVFSLLAGIIASVITLLTVVGLPFGTETGRSFLRDLSMMKSLVLIESSQIRLTIKSNGDGVMTRRQEFVALEDIKSYPELDFRSTGDPIRLRQILAYELKPSGRITPINSTLEQLPGSPRIWREFFEPGLERGKRYIRVMEFDAPGAFTNTMFDYLLININQRTQEIDIEVSFENGLLLDTSEVRFQGIKSQGSDLACPRDLTPLIIKKEQSLIKVYLKNPSVGDLYAMTWKYRTSPAQAP